MSILPLLPECEVNKVARHPTLRFEGKARGFPRVDQPHEHVVFLGDPTRAHRGTPRPIPAAVYRSAGPLRMRRDERNLSRQRSWLSIYRSSRCGFPATLHRSLCVPEFREEAMAALANAWRECPHNTETGVGGYVTVLPGRLSVPPGSKRCGTELNQQTKKRISWGKERPAGGPPAKSSLSQ
jgi:hypothetical protein